MSSTALPNPQPASTWSRYRPTTSFIGRERELDTLLRLVRDPVVRLITLLGPGGVGKTRLTLQLLEQLMAAPEGMAPPIDPIEGHFVSLSMVEANQVLPAVARALAIQEHGSRALEDLIGQAISDARGSHLLVLDNVEQVVDGLGFIPALLATTPNLTILVTSRTVLRFSAERIVPIAPFDTRSPDIVATSTDSSPAARLFIERARAVVPDLHVEDNPEALAAIEEICVQLDGLPLAIELAAARSRFFTPTALLRRISDRLRIVSDGPRDAPERHRTLRALLTWSNDLLEPDARILFRRLGIFVGSASLPAIEAVCNAHDDLGLGIEPLLTQLVDQSLIRIDQDADAEPRVRMLQTIRDYSREQLAFSGEMPQLQYAHAAWFASLTRDVPFSVWSTGNPEAAILTRRYYPDIANFNAALDYLLINDPPEAVQLTQGLCVFWLELGLLREGYAHVTRALPHTHGNDAHWETRCTLLRIATIFASEIGYHAEALAHIQESLALAEQYGTLRLRAIVRKMLAAATWQAGDSAEGERILQQAIDEADALSDRGLPASFRATLAEYHLEAGDLATAGPLLEESFQIMQEERESAVDLYAGSVALIALSRGELDRAAELFRTGLAYHSQPPYRQPPGRAARFIGIAELALKRGHPEVAARLLGAAEHVFLQMGTADRIGEVFGYAATNRAIAGVLGTERSRTLHQEGSRWTTPEAIEAALIATTLVGSAAASPADCIQPDQEIPAHRIAHLTELTARERDIFTELIQGRSNEAIAARLFISPRTVTTHVTRIYAKLGVSNRAEAIALAVAQGDA